MSQNTQNQVPKRQGPAGGPMGGPMGMGAPEKAKDIKGTLKKLIKLLSPYYNKDGFKEFIDQLIELSGEFDEVEYIYIFEQPSTDPANKITTINSRTEINMTNEQLKKISEKVKEIRKTIIA